MLPNRRIVIALALIGAFAAPARAQINVAWNDCLGQPNAAFNIDYACDGSRNGNPYRLVISFVAPVDLHAFVGIQATLSVESMLGSEGPNLAPMTDWWRMGVGECRDGNIFIPASMPGIGTGTTGACRNPYLGAMTGGGYSYTHDPGNPDRVRWLTAFARDTPVALTKDQQYVANVILFDTFGDVASEGAGFCAGCCERRALIVYSLELYQEPGQVLPQQDMYILNIAATRQYVMWQDHENCPTPSHRTSWGRIKSTYR